MHVPYCNCLRCTAAATYTSPPLHLLFLRAPSPSFLHSILQPSQTSVGRDAFPLVSNVSPHAAITALECPPVLSLEAKSPLHASTCGQWRLPCATTLFCCVCRERRRGVSCGGANDMQACRPIRSAARGMLLLTRRNNPAWDSAARGCRGVLWAQSCVTIQCRE